MITNPFLILLRQPDLQKEHERLLKTYLFTAQSELLEVRRQLFNSQSKLLDTQRRLEYYRAMEPMLENRTKRLQQALEDLRPATIRSLQGLRP